MGSRYDEIRAPRKFAPKLWGKNGTLFGYFFLTGRFQSGLRT